MGLRAIGQNGKFCFMDEAEEKIASMQAEIDELKKENKRILDAAISERTPIHRQEKE